MASRSRVIAALLWGLAIGVGLAAKPDGTLALGTCRASYSILGQFSGLTGPTPTAWFNVFGENYDPSVPATLTFGVPVIPWSVGAPTVVQPAVTTFSIPANYMSSGFKWTFRARDRNVDTIKVRISGIGCQADTLVDMSPPDTSTVEPRSAPADQSPVKPMLLFLVFSASMLAVGRRLDQRSRHAA